MSDQAPTPDENGGIPADLHADGLLWLVNRTVLHPRGYALGHDPGDPAGVVVLYGDGSEPWRYADSMVDTEDDLFAKVEALFARARAAHQPPG